MVTMWLQTTFELFGASKPAELTLIVHYIAMILYFIGLNWTGDLV